MSDEEWGLVEDLLPRQRKRRRGRRWRDHRQVLNGIFWILRTGSAWRDVPERYGPWRTCYARFVQQLLLRQHPPAARGPHYPEAGRGAGDSTNRPRATPEEQPGAGG